MDSKPWGFYQPFLVPVYAFYVVFAFFWGGNKVTVNLKYWLKPYTLHMLCFASLMYTNVLILNQKKKKKGKKNLVPYEVLLFHSLCVQVLLDLQLWLTVLLLVLLSLKCHFCHALVKKKKCTYYGVLLWRAAWIDQLDLERWFSFFCFFHSRVVLVFCLVFVFQLTSRKKGGGGIQRARQVDRACWSFLPASSILEKGSRNSGKHLWPVQVAHIRPLCCRCVGLLTPHWVSQRDAICDAFFVSGNFICAVKKFYLFVCLVFFFLNFDSTNV